MKYTTPETDAFDRLCRGMGVRAIDALPIIKKLEIKLAKKRMAHDVTWRALKLKSAECIRANNALRVVDQQMSGNEIYEHAWSNYPTKPAASPSSVVRKAISDHNSTDRQ